MFPNRRTFLFRKGRGSKSSFPLSVRFFALLVALLCLIFAVLLATITVGQESVVSLLLKLAGELMSIFSRMPRGIY